MKPARLTLRCYAKELDQHQWVAVCVDLDLAVQAESHDDARERLESMIHSYQDESFGDNRKFASQLLTRRGPLSVFLEYCGIKLGQMLWRGIPNGTADFFASCMPLRVA